MDVLRSAAILGVAMALTHIIKLYLLAFSAMSLGGASAVILFESLISAVLFIGMVYYFTRRVAKNWNERVEVMGQVFDVRFTYASALSYILATTMFAGVIVGVANTIYIDIMGYDLYVAGVMSRYQETMAVVEEYVVLTGDASVQTQFSELASQQMELIEGSDKPSMFMNILSYVSTYMMYGGLVGLVVAAVARRKPKGVETNN